MTVHNRQYLKKRRKQLRKKLTSAEAALWNLLKNQQLEGRKFRRQHSTGNYILDFYCASEGIAIELDGAHHFTDEGFKYDEQRTRYLNNLKIKVIRFENEEVFQSPDGVIAEIKKHFVNSDDLHGLRRHLGPSFE